MCLVPFTVQKCTCEIHSATFWESGQQITLRNENSLKLFFNLEQNDIDLRHTFSEQVRTYFRTGNANNSTSLYLSLLSKPLTLLFLNLTLGPVRKLQLALFITCCVVQNVHKLITKLILQKCINIKPANTAARSYK